MRVKNCATGEREAWRKKCFDANAWQTDGLEMTVSLSCVSRGILGPAES